MAQSGISIGTDAFPAIARLFGLNPPEENSYPQGQVPLQPPDQPSDAPTETSLPAAAVNPGPGEVLPPEKGTTKLEALRNLLTHGSPVAKTSWDGQVIDAAPDMSIGRPSLGAVGAVGDISQSMTADQAKIKPTFQEAHPLVARLLRGALAAGEGGLIGSQYANAGEGFQAARMAPIQRMMLGFGARQAQANLAQTQAKTKETIAHMEDVPVVVNGVTYMLAKDKIAGNLISAGSREKVAAQTDETKRLIGLRKQGLKPDESGNPVPIPYEELSPTEQAAFDLKGAQQEAAQARAAMDKAKNDPNSPAYQAALGRLRVSQQNAATAAGRLGLEKTKYLGDYLGLDAQGNPLPGVALTESGVPVGTRVANVTKPTNATRSKAEQAGVIKDQGNKLISMIDQNPDLFGVVAGRWNDFSAGKAGWASPEARQAYTALKSFASLQPALHGSRGIGMQKEFEDALGGLKDNPEALKASVRSLMDTASAFKKAGTMPTYNPKPKSGGNDGEPSNKFGFVPLPTAGPH